MTFDALRASTLGITFDLLGVDVTVTRPTPDDAPVLTTGIWLEPLEEERPAGPDLQRRDPRKVMTIARSAALPGLPRGTVIVAPELEGGDRLTWRVDGYERAVEPDLMRVMLVRAADQ